MVLNNMIRYLKMVHLTGGMIYYSSPKTITLPEPIVNVNGTSYNTYYLSSNKSDYSYSPHCPFRSFNSSIMTSQTSGSSGITSIMFGNGTTPVAETDYSLQNPITSGLSIVSLIQNPTYTLSDDGNRFTQSVHLEIGLKNTSNSPINVSEVGFYDQLITTTTAGSTKILLHREVFDTVTIDAGTIGSFVFDFTIERNIA